jgi:hypothetical protein
MTQTAVNLLLSFCSEDSQRHKVDEDMNVNVKVFFITEVEKFDEFLDEILIASW